MSTKWCTIAPVEYSDPRNYLNLPVHFGDGVVFDRIPDWLKGDKFVNELGVMYAETVLKYTRFVLSVEYNAEALGSPDPNWKGDEPRSIQDAKHETINFVNIAIWLTKPGAFGFNTILHFDEMDAEKNLRSFQQVRNVKPHPVNTKDHILVTKGDLEDEDFRNLYLQDNDLIKTKDLHITLLSLPRKSTVWTSVWSLWHAIREPMGEIRLLLFWIALEALFGPEDNRELTFKLSQRVGFFLGENRPESFEIFQKTKKTYGLRSKIVHGLHLSKIKQEDFFQLSFDTQELARKSIFKILTIPGLIEKFNNDREQFLDQLIFS